MPYTIRKGVLYHDGRAQIALGQSYYPSYHPQKVPVPPTGDRLGEMAKDLRAMREAGFNVVRMAALGDVTYDQGKVSVDFPLPDAFCRMCEEQDLGAMIRLQGYSMNLRNFPDATMVDQQGQPMENAWSWFIRNCVNHPGIIEDNRMGTRASAAHFAAFPAVCSFQIYNEPIPTWGCMTIIRRRSGHTPPGGRSTACHPRRPRAAAPPQRRTPPVGWPGGRSCGKGSTASCATWPPRPRRATTPPPPSPAT